MDETTDKANAVKLSEYDVVGAGHARDQQASSR